MVAGAGGGRRYLWAAQCASFVLRRWRLRLATTNACSGGCPGRVLRVLWLPALWEMMAALRPRALESSNAREDSVARGIARRSESYPRLESAVGGGVGPGVGPAVGVSVLRVVCPCIGPMRQANRRYNIRKRRASRRDMIRKKTLVARTPR